MLVSVLYMDGKVHAFEYKDDLSNSLRVISAKRYKKILDGGGHNICLSLENKNDEWFIPHGIKKYIDTDILKIDKNNVLGLTQMGKDWVKKGLDCISVPKYINSVRIDTISDYAFMDSYFLFISMPHILNIGQGAFLRSHLKFVEIPKDVKVIKEETFAESLSLCGIKFNKCLEVIEDYAFYDCYNLKKINLPLFLKRVGILVFGSIYNLEIFVNEGVYNILKENSVSEADIIADLDEYAFEDFILEERDLFGSIDSNIILVK